jgi:hypothetical protein
MGWNLETHSPAAIVGGKFVRVATPGRKVVDLYRDGAMIFAVRADREFLAWGQGQEKLNPLALVESIFSFADFYGRVASDASAEPSHLTFRIDLKNLHLDQQKSLLAPFGLRSSDQITGYGAKGAPAPNWTQCIDVAVAEYDSAAIAYSLVREVYLWFGLEEDKIPYTKQVDGKTKIDIEAISVL